MASVVVLMAAAGALLSAQAPSLGSITALSKLTNAQAAHRIPADFDATVIYYRDYERTLFVQDGNTAIYVQPSGMYALRPGDRVHIQGVTRESFRPIVVADQVTLLEHGALPAPVAANFDELIHARLDCRLVTVQGRVLSADVALSSDRRNAFLRLQTESGPIDVQMDNDDPALLAQLLDAEVRVTGAVSGNFDGKMQMTGIVIHAQSVADLQVVRPAAVNPWSLPIAPMDEIVFDYRASTLSHRVRVQGIVTYYVPGSAIVLQNGSRSLWINSATRADLHLGDQVDATGFPDVRDGFLRLANGEILNRHVNVSLQAKSVPASELAQSHHVFDLISTTGRVVAEVREARQDQYLLSSEGHLFTAIFRHPAQTGTAAVPLPRMKQVPIGSTVQVAGICILEDSNPFNAQVPFDLLLRSFDDIQVIAHPPLLTVGNLTKVVSGLLLVVLAVSAWGWTLRRKVLRQTRAMARRAAAEATQERRNAQIEQRRSRILEDINGTRPLSEVLEEITELVSFHLGGAPCWCEITDGARLGQYLKQPIGRRIVREEIPARSGPALGALYLALEEGFDLESAEQQAILVGTRLATLAIETRRLYTDLVHRSEFDLLTDINNRFSLDKQLEALILRARDQAGIFGLIYVDLDEFKQVNDIYGHRVGDLYLQQAAARMKRQLRLGDILARLGGDEFAVVVPAARSRNDVEEIARRLERCFDDPFQMEGYTLRGSASIGMALYPDDGITKDSLLSAADAAMYVAKHTRRHTTEEDAASTSRSSPSNKGR